MVTPKLTYLNETLEKEKWAQLCPFFMGSLPYPCIADQTLTGQHCRQLNNHGLIHTCAKYSLDLLAKRRVSGDVDLC